MVKNNKRWFWLNRELLANQTKTAKKNWHYLQKNTKVMYISNSHVIFVVPKKSFYLDKKKVFIGEGLFIKRIIDGLELSDYKEANMAGIKLYLDKKLAELIIDNDTKIHVNYQNVEPLISDFGIENLKFLAKSPRNLVICYYEDQPIAYLCPFRI